MTETKWEKVGGAEGRAEHGDVWRFPVPGGWIYSTQNRDGTEGTCFVPAAAEARLPAEVSGEEKAWEFRVGDVVAPTFSDANWTRAEVTGVAGGRVDYKKLDGSYAGVTEWCPLDALRLVSRPAPAAPAETAGEEGLVLRVARTIGAQADVLILDEERCARMDRIARAVLGLLRAEGRLCEPGSIDYRATYESVCDWFGVKDNVIGKAEELRKRATDAEARLHEIRVALDLNPEDSILGEIQKRSDEFDAEERRVVDAEARLAAATKELETARGLLAHLAEVAGKASSPAAPAALAVGARVRVKETARYRPWRGVEGRIAAPAGEREAREGWRVVDDGQFRCAFPADELEPLGGAS